MAAPSAFVTSTLRAIRASLGRFLAIMGITALGCGFFAGLQMCGPDMRAAADAWYDGSRVWDLRLVSTQGWSGDDVARIGNLAGIEAVMPATSLDAMARLGGEQLAVRISTLNVASAMAATPEGTTAIASADDGYLNRVRLTDGRWPTANDECVVCGDAVVSGSGIGAVVEVLATAAGTDDLLRTRSFTIVGTVTAAAYPYTANFGSTTLGAGMVEQYLYVPPAAMAADAAYTDVFALVEGAAAHESEGDAYERVVAGAAELVATNEGALMDARLADVRDAAQAELDEQALTLASARADADDRLAAGSSELDAAAARLAEGERELAEGEASYAAGRAALERERAAVASRLDAAAAELAAGERELAEGEAAHAAGEARVAAGERELAAREAELLAAIDDEGLPASSIDEATSSVASARAAAEAGLANLAEAASGLERLAAAKAGLAVAEGQVGELAGAYERAAASLASQGYPHACVDAPTAAGAAWLSQLEAWALAEGVPSEVVERGQAVAALARELLAQTQALVAAKDELAAREAELLAAIADEGLPASSIDEATSSVASARAAAEAGLANLAEAASGLERLAAANAGLAAGRAELAASASELAAGRARLASASAELDAGRLDAASQLRAASAELDAGAATLAASRAELAAGRAELAGGRSAWEAARADADASLAGATAELAAAQAKIDDLSPGELYVLDRTKSEGAATYHADTERMDAIAAVFPLMFFLVAALVALTTMTRMVEDERVQIGTYKALGYSTRAIAARYLAYAAAASVVGATFGIALLTQVLPVIVTSAYGIIYAVPTLGLPLPVSLPVILASGGLGVGVTLAATWVAVVASLRETPATLMLPRPPAAGRRILLERIPLLWRHLSFSWKVTFRNLFRFKRRLLMTVVGVSGCTALLLVGFGLHDAIWDIIDCQYGPLIHYDTTVSLDDDAAEADVDAVASYLAGTGALTDLVRVHSANLQAAGNDGGATMRVQAVVPTSANELARAVTLRTRVGHTPIAFGDDAVVITEKLALKYGIGVGDALRLFEQDATGNAVGEGHALTVTGVTENYVGNLVYVGRRAWRVLGGEPVFSTLHATTRPDAAARAALTDALHDLPHVSTVAFSDETIATYRTMLSVVDMIVVVLIVSAAALAAVVLYNLTNINVAERVREIASLKVLGFTRREVYAYIFREVLLLAVLGAALGMVLGTWLASFVVTTAEVDYVMFGRSIHPPSYAYAFALTLAFTLVIAALMRRRLDRIDMVESLKSLD